MGSLRRSNDVILAKIESTYNVDPTPAAATDAKFVYNAQLSTEGLRMVDRPGIRGFIGDLQRIYGGQLAKLTLECEMKGSGAAGTAPEIGTLLRGCAFVETVVASTSVTYKPASTGHESITIYYYEGGRKLHKLTGCRGMVTFRLSAGGFPIASFTFVGHVSNPTDASQPTPTLNSQKPIPLIGLSVTVNSVSVVPQEISFDMGLKLAYPPSMNAADGYGEIQITDRSVVGQILTDAELASVIDYDALLSAGTQFVITTGTIGSVAGNRLAISTPSQAYFLDRQFTEGDGQRRRTMPFAVADAPTTDSELSLAFT